MRYQAYVRSRYKALLGYSGWLWVLIGLAVASPVLILPFYPEEAVYAPIFPLVGLPIAAVGYLLARFFRPDDSPTVSLNEGMLLIVIAWVLALVVGSIPFLFTTELNFTQAFFESTSAWTTTGLTVVDFDNTPRIVFMYRSILQLIGGAGFAIIVLTALVGPAGSGLSAAEGRDDQLAPNVRQSASIVLRIYLSYIAFGIIAYLVVGMSLFDAINHAFSAVSTGGFSPHAGSIGHFDNIGVEVVTIVLMLLGSINFLTAYIFFKGKFHPVWKNGEIRLMGLLLIGGVIMLLLGTVGTVYSSAGEQLRVAIFEIASAVSTTGFTITSYAEWNDLGILVLVILMLMGGGSGSTAGGIKLFRIYVMLKGLWWEMRRPFLPEHAVNKAVVWRGDHRSFLNDTQVRHIATFIVMYTIMFFAGTFILVAYEYSVHDSMFEAASTLAGVGLSIGITAPDAPLGVLWFEIIGMFLGRLEFFAVIIGVTKLFRDVVDFIRVRRE